ncbi:MAG: LamG domain-containing protein [Candidatus Poribacteria bacterium]|nr:LamG domain-containing protein [Candidatus Poribacteria bacterium]
MKTITMTFVLIFLAAFVALPVFAQNVIDGLVAYWAFDEESGDTASDSSGNGHHGKLVGDPQWTKDGKFGGALEFDQTQDEVNVPFHKDLNQETFTICAWANAASGGTGHRAVISSRADFPQRGYIFYAEPGNKWQFWIGAGANSWKPVTGPAVNLDKWDHLAGTYADGNHKFYVNGEFVGEQNFEIAVNPEQEFLIGAGANETANHNYFFRGKIDEVGIYDRVLTEAEIAAVMESNPTAVEASGKIAVTWGQLKAK